jgi:hypothetical protein
MFLSTYGKSLTFLSMYKDVSDVFKDVQGSLMFLSTCKEVCF